MSITLCAAGGGNPETMTIECRNALAKADCIIGASRLIEDIDIQKLQVTGMPDESTEYPTGCLDSVNIKTQNDNTGECHEYPTGCLESSTGKASCELKKAVNPDEILRYIKGRQGRNICIIYSGDTGFYSGAAGLIRLLEAEKLPFSLLPGLSSVQLLSARLCLPWQEWRLVSAHGIACDAVCEIVKACGKPVFFLTGGELTPDVIARQLCDAGYNNTKVIIGENLSYNNSEKISQMTAEKAAAMRFSALSVMLVFGEESKRNSANSDEMPVFGEESKRNSANSGEMPIFGEESKRISANSDEIRSCEPAWNMPGIPDEEFIRGSVPMTKREIRALIMMTMEIRNSDTVWDIGAGTGSISIEAALTAYNGEVYAIECVESAIELISANREKFKARNLKIVKGYAPEALSGLPKPDRVFIGGSRGHMRDIIDAALIANPKAVICISAIAIESANDAISALEEHGIDAQIMQLAVSHGTKAGKLHMMMAQNPIMLINGTHI